MDTSYISKIKERIENAPNGSVFCASDFCDITSIETINRCLSRLTEKGILRRVYRGLFEKPRFSKMLNRNVVPNIDNVVFAIARTNGWNIAPSENSAMNLLGIDSQVPNEIEYVSNGPYREYRIDIVSQLPIIFKHVAPKDISNMSLMSATFVQAIKGKGKNNIHDDTIIKLSSRLNSDNKAILLNETKHVTSWVYEIVKRICI